MSLDDYKVMVEETHVETRLIEYRVATGLLEEEGEQTKVHKQYPTQRQESGNGQPVEKSLTCGVGRRHETGTLQFVLTVRLNTERVDFLFHKVVKSIINQAMPGKRIEPFETARDYSDLVMTPAARGAGMPHMQMTLVFNFHGFGRQFLPQAVHDEINGFHFRTLAARY